MSITQGQTKFEGAFIATNERLIMNVDMNGQFYYRNIRYDEINQIHFDGSDIIFEFNIEQFQCVKLRQKMYKLLLII